MRNFVVLTFFLLFSVGPMGIVVAYGKNAVNVETIRSTLKTRNIDEIIDVMNKIKMLRYQGHVLPYLDSLWHGKTDELPNESWDVIKLDIVRLEIADILLQADNNGDYKADRKEIHKFVRNLLNRRKDSGLIRRALLVLSHFDCEDDVDFIVSIALNEDRRTFRAAIIALADMCNEKAKKALVSLSNKLKREDYREYVRIKSKELHELQKKWRLCEPIE